MKRQIVGLLAAGSALVFMPAAWPIGFTVTIDTSALMSHASAPFSLDFQFIDGEAGGDGNNSILLSDFDFHGGGWAGVPATSGGTTLGVGSIMMTDSAFFSDFLQEFSPGSLLSFKVSMTTFADPGGTPDLFSLAILDGGLAEIPTQGFFDAFLTVELGSSGPTLSTFASDLSRTDIDIAAPAVVYAAVPDSSVSPVLLGGVWMALLAGALAGRLVRLS